MKVCLLFLLLPLVLAGQERQKLVFRFDQCALDEENQFVSPLVLASAGLCDCGLESDALRLDQQSVSLSAEVDTTFYGNFSLGFSVLLESGPGTTDLVSKMSFCNADTSMNIVYQSDDSIFVCTFQQGFDKIVQLVGKADVQSCWQQLVIVRSDGKLRLFVNGRLRDERNTSYILRLNNRQPLRFNASPCPSVVRAKGLLDQVFLANYPMNITEVASELILQDQILTPDTLIFLGASVSLRAVSDCATRVQWTPLSYLTSADILQPTATPPSEIQYVLSMQNAFCRATDTVLIRVVDTSQSDCSKLHLPTAFTPNGDEVNDQFFISNNYLVERLHYFDILDRNGGLMVRITDPKAGWDGSLQGTLLNPGSYLYRIAYTCKGRDYKTKGSVFLLR